MTDPNNEQVDAADGSELAARAAEQRVESVDEHGAVLEIVTRAEMRDRGLRHRCVYVVVRGTDGRILIHRRADWKDVYPGAWDLAFGGVCDPGESWITSALRELHEEAGVVASESDLEDLGSVSWERPGVALIGHVFQVTYDGPFEFNDGEVTATRWQTPEQLVELVAENELPGDTTDLIYPLLAEPTGPAA